MKKIIPNINHYFLLSQAGLREDMAKRIMYSLVTNIDDPKASGFRINGPRTLARARGEEYPYERPHPVDIHALNLAIEGWKDIVKYGTKAVVGELKHSSRDYENRIFQRAFDLYNKGKYIEALDLAIEDYAKPWKESYGGKAWGKIAAQVKEILLLGKKIEQDPSNHDHKINMVIALNVFDGLAHNTASIMRNLVDIESATSYDYDGNYKTYQHYEDIHDPDFYELSDSQRSRSSKEYKRILELMDAKELKGGLDVWREIKPEIEGMGAIYFKPLKRKLHDMELAQIISLTPEEKAKKRDEVKIELVLIRFRKQIMSDIEKFDNRYNDSQSVILELRQLIEKLKPAIADAEKLENLKDNPQVKLKARAILRDLDKKYLDMRDKFVSLSDPLWSLKSLVEKLNSNTTLELINSIAIQIEEKLNSKLHDFSKMEESINSFINEYYGFFDPYRLQDDKIFTSTTKINEFIENLDNLVSRLKTTQNSIHDLKHI